MANIIIGKFPTGTQLPKHSQPFDCEGFTFGMFKNAIPSEFQSACIDWQDIDNDGFVKHSFRPYARKAGIIGFAP